MSTLNYWANSPVSYFCIFKHPDHASVSSIHCSAYFLSPKLTPKLTVPTAAIDFGLINIRCEADAAELTQAGEASVHLFGLLYFPSLQRTSAPHSWHCDPLQGLPDVPSVLISISQDATLQLLPTFWGSIVMCSSECGKRLWFIRIAPGAHPFQQSPKWKQKEGNVNPAYNMGRFWRHAEWNKLITMTTLTWGTGVHVVVNTVNLVGSMKRQNFVHVCELFRFGWGEVIYPKRKQGHLSLSPHW